MNLVYDNHLHPNQNHSSLHMLKNSAASQETHHAPATVQVQADYEGLSKLLWGISLGSIGKMVVPLTW